MNWFPPGLTLAWLSRAVLQRAVPTFLRGDHLSNYFKLRFINCPKQTLNEISYVEHDEVIAGEIRKVHFNTHVSSNESNQTSLPKSDYPISRSQLMYDPTVWVSMQATHMQSL